MDLACLCVTFFGGDNPCLEGCSLYLTACLHDHERFSADPGPKCLQHPILDRYLEMLPLLIVPTRYFACRLSTREESDSTEPQLAVP